MNSIVFASFICILALCAANAAAKVPAPPKSTTSPTRPTAAPLHCTGKIELMVPLYTSPGAAWDQVAAGARLVPTVAIINPNNGPAAVPSGLYLRYMQKLHDAGVTMIGYVRTDYGRRDMAKVLADINTYAAEYPLLSGIFLDESAAIASKLPYYQSLYTYITQLPGWTYDVINTGIIPHSGYYDVSTQIVSFADYGVSLASASIPTWASCAKQGHFVGMVHTVHANIMQTTVDALFEKSYFGYIYLTDGMGVNSALPLYYSTMISYIAAKQVL